MSEALDKLEKIIYQLLDKMDALQSENKTIRDLAGGKGNENSSDEIAEKIQSLRLEKEKMERTLVRVEQRLESIISQLDKLEI